MNNKNTISKKEFIHCTGCGASVPDIQGPTHKYLGAFPGCWKIFGDILAKEYSDQAYMRVHRLTVDAYAVQHIGDKSPQTIQSINLHLLALCVALEHGVKYSFIPQIMNKKIKEYKNVFAWLSPPKYFGAITVVDVAKAKNAKEHEKLVSDWAKAAWDSWKHHHKIIENYLRSIDYY